MSLLDEWFSDIDKRLKKKLDDARRVTTPNAVRGDALAGELGQEIRDHLIDCGSLHEKCQVRDTHDRISQEIDLVLLNRFHPPFLLRDRPPILYIEGVLAAAEVKAALDKNETVDCLKKARAFKQLVAEVHGNDLKRHTIDNVDWPRYLWRRPFFAFAYEDRRTLRTIQRNIVEWVRDNGVPESEQIDALFVLNKGIIINLGSGMGTIEIADDAGNRLSGFVRSATPAVFSQLITWLSRVCPSFSSLDPILLKYSLFQTGDYTS
jgi:hypothetical protein